MLDSIASVVLLNGLSTLQRVLVAITATILMGLFAALEIFKPPHKRRDMNGKKWKMPPGPSGIPLFGSVYKVRKGPPAASEFRQFGEMATLQVGSKTWVLLNSNRVVNEIINKRGSLTNDRPEYPVSSDLLSQGKRAVLLKIPEWTERRRVTHQVLSGTAMKTYAEYQDLESVQLLLGYLTQPSKWFEHNNRYANSVIYRVAYGKRVLEDTAHLDAIRQVHEDFLHHNPPNNMIDCFPLLSRLPKPLQWWRKSGLELGKRLYDVYRVYWDPIYQDIRDGVAPASFARDVLAGENAKFRGTSEDAMYLAGELIEAGSETTRIGINTFVMAAICQPQAFQKAREELDAVCGSDGERMPSFEDEPKLRYILAFLKEILRWRPLIVWGTEHCSTEVFEFEGYRFPVGTNFVINNLAAGQDTNKFTDPHKFEPERWLDGKEGDILAGTTGFGGGRRVCVGYRLAQKSLFINVARLIYCFNFKAAGKVNSEVLNNHSRDEPFPISASVRSEKHKALIIEEAKKRGTLES